MLSLTQGLLVHFQDKDELGGAGLDYCSTPPPLPPPPPLAFCVGLVHVHI